MGPPEGTIALLFTDIEGSTALVTRLGERWREVLADHHALVGTKQLLRKGHAFNADTPPNCLRP